jgi:Dolichyl-phosphate-mannose-protein mannosyltransferase
VLGHDIYGSRLHMTARDARPPSDESWSERWPLALIAITAVGLGLRAYYAQATIPPGPHGDPAFYHETARALAAGHGYIGSHTLGTVGATAEHPPLYSSLVATITWLGAKGEASQRLIASLICGAAFIPVMGYLGRRVAGRRVGLLAALIAAVTPTLIVAQGSGESEALFGVFVGLILLSTYRLSDRPNLREAPLCGLWIGLAALTRSDALFFLLLPLLVVLRSARPKKWRTLAAVMGITGIVLAPWVVRNWAQFGRPTLSTNLGTLVAGTNCGPAYYGPTAGSFHAFGCITPLPNGSELDRSDALVHRGVDYAKAHASRLPYLIAVRFLNVWGLRDRANQFEIYAAGASTQRVERATYYVFLLLAVVGAVFLWWRRAVIWPLLIPFAITSLLAVTSYGTARFRHGSEISMVLFVAAAVDLAVRSIRDPRGALERASAVLTTGGLSRRRALSPYDPS